MLMTDYYDNTSVPELNLWFTVLHLYIDDARNERRTDYDIEKMHKQLNHFWTKKICDLVGWEHNFFTEKIMKIVDENEPRRKKYRKEQRIKKEEALKEAFEAEKLDIEKKQLSLFETPELGCAL